MSKVTRTSDPLELATMDVLDRAGIRYQFPHGRLDFFLPDFNVHIECKAWACERMYDQLKNERSVIVLIGIESVKAFARLILK